MNHCRSAQDLLLQKEIELKIGISIISEPYRIPDNVTWVSSINQKAAIHWNYQFVDSCGMMTVKGVHSVAMRWKHFNIVSCYISPNADDDEYTLFLEELDQIVNDLRYQKTIIAGDFNAKDTLWGARYTNSRGEKLSRWISSKDIRLLNDGISPTCIRHQGTSIVDLTWATADISCRIMSWEVMNEFTDSDHAYIKYELQGNNVQKNRGGKLRNEANKYVRWCHKKMDIELFQETLEWKSATVPQWGSAEESATWLQETIGDACDISMPRAKTREKLKLYWWNDSIADLRRTCNKARKKWQKIRAKRDRTQEELTLVENIYRTVKANLRTEINKSKNIAWEELIKTIEDDPWGLPYKIVLNKLRRSSPGVTETLPPDVLEEAISRLFPQDNEWNKDCDIYNENDEWNNDDDIIFPEVYKVICKRPVANKAPGKDGIKSAYLKRVPDSMLHRITQCFNICLQSGKFPARWKEAILVLIPKSRIDINDLKVRPICLLNEMGKALERILVNRIELWIHDNPDSGFTDRQYGFRKAKSTCDALWEVQNYIQEAMQNKEVVIGVSLDIRNAFNSIKWSHIRNALRAKNFPIYIRKIIDNYLSERYIEYVTHDGTLIKRKVTAGVPQGSVLGPMLWNLAYDWALRSPLEGQSIIVGYADDTLLLIRSPNVIEAVATTNRQISRVLNRIRKLELEVSETKTEIVLFHAKRMKIDDNIPQIRVGTEAINIQKSMKYLGIYLDTNWTFNEHINYIEEKVMNITRQLGRLMPNLHGPMEKKRRLYANTISSVIMYGAPIWGEALSTSRTLQNKITRVQRIIALRVVAGYRTVSADAALVLARIPPAAIQAMYWRRVFLRIKDLKRNDEWDTTKEAEIKQDEKVLLTRQWSIMLLRDGGYGKRTCEAIAPILQQWMERNHGEMTYRITQLLTGHGVFYKFLYRIGKADNPFCPFCAEEEDSTEHTLQSCSQWDYEREELVREIGSDLQISTIVRKICNNKEAWRAFNRFAEKVMLYKEEDERTRQQGQ